MKRVFAFVLSGLLVFVSVFVSYRSVPVYAFAGVTEGVIISSLMSLIGLTAPNFDAQNMVNWWQDPTNDVANFIRGDFVKQWQNNYDSGKCDVTWDDYVDNAIAKGALDMGHGVWDFLKDFGARTYEAVHAGDSVPGLPSGISFESVNDIVHDLAIKQNFSVYSSSNGYFVSLHKNYIVCRFYPKPIAYLRCTFSGYVLDACDSDGNLVKPKCFESPYSLSSVSYSPLDTSVTTSMFRDRTASSSVKGYVSYKDYLEDNAIDDWQPATGIGQYYDIVGTFSELKDALLGLTDTLSNIGIAGIDAVGDFTDTIPIDIPALTDYSIGNLTYEDYLDSIRAQIVDTTDDTVISDNPTKNDTPAKPDSGTKEYLADLKKLFPFCIPFDLIHAFSALSALSEAPVFRFPVSISVIGLNQEVVIDMSKYDEYIQVFRILETLGFIISLIVLTRSLIKG